MSDRSADSRCDSARPSVSVVIPVHNGATTLHRAVDSALGQEGVRVSVIVVNDHSTDDWREVLPLNEPRVTVLHSAMRGPAAARNTGIRVAEGEFLSFLDADDYWLPGFLNAVTRLLRDYPHVGAASTPYLIDGGRVRKRMPSVRSETANRLARGELPSFLATYAKLGLVCTGSVCLRRSMLTSADLMREDLRTGEDTEFWAYLGARLRWCYVPMPLVVVDVRHHGERADEDDPSRLPDLSVWRQRLDLICGQEDRHTLERICSRMARFQARWLLLRGYPQKAKELLRTYPVYPNAAGRTVTWVLVSLPTALWRAASRMGGVLLATTRCVRRVGADMAKDR